MRAEAVGVDSRSSSVAHSEESEEPWDQNSGGSNLTPLATKSTESDIRAPSEETNSYSETGDLPALTSGGGMGGRMINGQRTTTRPLNPPSSAGLRSDDAREFWDQLNDDREDGPDDEAAAYRRQRANDSEYMLSEYVEVTDEDNTYCGQTLEAISEICAGGSGTTKRDPPGKITKHTGEAAEEQTAIEVEYVEPAKTMSPQRKNAYLSAMARKAKSTFKSSSPTKERPRAVSPPQDTTDEDASNDVYAGFSASEKRKFLKLINSGSAPADASKAIIADREQRATKQKKSQSRAVTPKGTRAEEKNSSPTRRAKRLAFWKAHGTSKSAFVKGNKSPTRARTNAGDDQKNKKKTSAGVVVAAAAGVAAGAAAVGMANREERNPEETPIDEVEPQPRGTETKKTSDVTGATLVETDSSEDEAFKKSGINYYDAVRRDDGPVLEDLGAPTPRREARSRALKARNTNPRRGFAELKGQGSSDSSPMREGNIAFDLPAPAGAVPPASVNRAAGIVANEEQGEDRISEQDASVMEMIEKELMRPVKSRESRMKQTGSVAEESTLEAFVANEAQPFSDEATLPSPPPTPDERAGAQSRSVGNSNSMMSEMDKNRSKDDLDVDIDTYFNSTDLYSLTGGGDTASVYSAGTGVTGQSGYTLSSRVRRPGAAKERLKRSRSADGRKPNGWHESIRAAAKATNRRWDANKGWVDYEEPKMDLSGDLTGVSHDEKIHLDLSKTLRRDDKNSEGNEKTPRETVQVPFPSEWEEDRSQMLLDPELVVKKEIPEATSTDIDDGNASYRSRGSTPSHSQGWIASMKAASAALGKDGRKWDPEKGWTTLKDDEYVSDVVDFDALPTEQSQGKAVSDAPVEPGVRSDKGDDASGSQKLTNWMARSENKPVETAARSTESSDLAITSTSSDPYLQIADSGDVKQKGKSESDEDAHASSLDSDGAFPSFGGYPTSKATGVVKERVGESDMELFSANDVSKEAPSNISPRRGAGPVDLDVSDVGSDSSDEEAKAWDSSAYMLALGAKKVPKLGGPKRDTSPLRKTAGEPTPNPTNQLGVKQEQMDRSRAQASVGARPRQPDVSSSPVATSRAPVDSTTYPSTAIAVTQPAIVTPPSAGRMVETPEVQPNSTDEDDSLFEFVDQAAASQPSELESSKLSPIRPRLDVDEQEGSIVYGSEAYGPAPGEKKSFFSRIAECTAPAVPAAKPSKNGDVASSHLEFLRRQNPSAFCARPDDVIDGKQPLKKSSGQSGFDFQRKERMKSPQSSSSSVVSEDFGAKTAYLDAIAMKTAVSKPKRSGSRSRGGRSGGSSVVSGTSEHSEKWKTLLAKKKASESGDQTGFESPKTKEVAEKYTSKRVQEMMSSISFREKGKTYNTGASAERNSTVEAADDLAAARIEAMMSSLRPGPAEEGEI